MDANRNHGIDAYAKKLISIKAWQLVGKAGLTKSDVDDLVQELTLDLLKRLPKFNPRKAALRTFVTQVVERQISTILRHRMRYVRDYRREAFSLNQVDEQNPASETAIADRFSQEAHDRQTDRRTRSRAEEAQLICDVRLVLAKLPPEMRELCECLMMGRLAEAARRLGIPRTTLAYRIEKLTDHFEQAGLQKYLDPVRHFEPRRGK